MDIGITAIGTANPTYKRSQLEVAELIADCLHLKPVDKRLLKSVYKASGIAQRYSVLRDYSMTPGQFEFFPNEAGKPFPSTAKRMKIYKDNAIHLALQAVKNCFADLSFDKSAITHLITVSCTGMYAPGLDIELIHQLQLNPSLERTAINFMGCYGAFNAIKVANAVCKANPKAVALVVSVELCSIHFQENMTIDNLIANAIFSDGAAAALVQATTHEQKCLQLLSFYCDLLPQTTHEMAWNIADKGFDIVLSSYVPEAIESGIQTFLKKLLNQSHLSLADIQLYAIHPGGVKILQACEKALGIDKIQNKYAYQVLQDYGNMSSATVLFVLRAILNDLDIMMHDKTIFSCAFGPGLTLESMILKTRFAEDNN